MPRFNSKRRGAGSGGQAIKKQAGNITGTGSFSVWGFIWPAGTTVCLAVFIIAYILCYKRFYISLPVENPAVEEWLKSHKSARNISVRQSCLVKSPLSYGILHPVILMPEMTDWEDTKHIQYILEHEFVHIKRLDAAAKIFLIIAVSLHWFNPLVWVMYILVNRDIELACDETVIRHFGEKSKKDYAMLLINMEEEKNNIIPSGSSFSRNAAEERIIAIMKIKKTSRAAYIMAVLLVTSIISVFATSEAGTARNMDAGISQKMKKKITANSTVSVKKKENGITADTSLSAGEQEKLFKQYKEYEIENKDGILYYKNKPVRCLADIYGVVSYNENGGRTINSKSIYSYFNEKGKINVCIERENINSGENWSFGKIINWSLSLEDMAFAMPEKVINKLLSDSIKKGNYDDLGGLVVFANEESINSAANQIMAKGDYDMIEVLAWNTEPYALGRIAVQLVEKKQYDVLNNITAFLEKKDLDEIAEILCSKKEYDVFNNILWALDKNTVDKYAKQFADKGEFDALGNIAWNVSREVLEELAKSMTDKGEYEGLMYIVPFLAWH